MLLLSYSITQAQTLSAGDIAIVGVNTDGPGTNVDEIAIVTLASIPSGTTIYFSDYYWDNTNSRWGNNGLNGTTINNGEGIVKWTTTATIAAGTVYKITLTSGTPAVSGLPGMVSIATGWSSSSVGPFGGSDNFFVYQSNNNGVTPSNWIFGWTNGLTNSVSCNNCWQTVTSPILGQISMLPSGLTNGTNAVSFAQIGTTASNPSYDNNVYNTGSLRTGTKAALLAAICNTSNWVGDENTAYDISPTSTYFSAANAFAITGTLPLSWQSVTGNLNAQKKATINWQVQENNVAKYVIEKGTDGRIFNAFGTTSSKGDGKNSYSYLDINTLGEVLYYRIKQIDNDGRFSYSSIIKLADYQISSLTIYPNPVKDLTTLEVNNNLLNTKATLTDIRGKFKQTIIITQSFTNINLSGYTNGIYLLRMQSGEVIKIIKQ